MRLGADRQTREALLGPSGSLSAGGDRATRNLADIGAVVQGVNDEQVVDQTASDSAAAAGPMRTFPMSATALADQQSRAARYGEAGAHADGPRQMASADNTAPPPAAHPGARPRAFDASEGTPLDPLLNTTYDLNYPKVVPPLK